ncbi:MAG: exodeoxyribonuclease III [Gammaproteobacteria bacterium]
MLLATWNVNSLKVRLPHLLTWLQSARPDIVALQETKLVDEAFPTAELEEAGYHCAFAGQKTYNGVAVLSREAITDVVTDLPGYADPQRRVLGCTVGDVRVLNLYVPNGQTVDSEKYHYKLDWLKALEEFCRDELKAHPLMAAVGDFNIAPADRDVHDPDAWRGSVLVSPAEREAFDRLTALGFVDTFRLFNSDGGFYSWWDYRMGGFRRNHGLRIDHVLASKQLAERCLGATIDVEPRTWNRPSDHVPVVARFS